MLDPSRQYTTCTSCGTSISEAAFDRHRCDPLHRSEHGIRVAREELVGFERELAAYLATPRGRFEAYYAQRERRRGLL